MSLQQRALQMAQEGVELNGSTSLLYKFYPIPSFRCSCRIIAIQEPESLLRIIGNIAGSGYNGKIKEFTGLHIL